MRPTEYTTTLDGEYWYMIADDIFVINVGGCIGSSTREEIEYAKEPERSFGI